MADPAGSFAASFAIDAVMSADIAPSNASRSAASAPNPGTTPRGASMKPVQNRTGFTSASSHDSHDVAPSCRAAAQLDRSTLLPAPADPTTTVSRFPAPASSRPYSADLARRVAGSVVGRNFASGNSAARRGLAFTGAHQPATPATGRSRCQDLPHCSCDPPLG